MMQYRDYTADPLIRWSQSLGLSDNQCNDEDDEDYKHNYNR